MIIKNPIVEIPEFFKKNKDFRKFIRSKVFTVNSRDITGKYQITYLKYDVNHLSINIKIIGTWNYYNWRIGRNKVCLTSSFSKKNSRSRNYDIRNAIRNDIKSFFRLMGVKSYDIKIKTINPKENL